MIERQITEANSGSGHSSRASAGRPAWRSALVLAAVGAMLLAACGTASVVEDGGATITPTEVASAASGSTGRDAKVILPSLVGASSGTSTLFPEVGNGGYEVSIYNWDLALSDDLTSLSGVATITAVTTQDLERFSLDSRELHVESVTVDDTPVDFYVTGPKLVITTSEALPIESEFVVRVVYAAEPGLYLPDQFLKGWDVDPGEQVFVAGLPGAAATWTPTNDDPAAPPARYIMRFDVPDGFTATASGTLIEEDEGSGSVVWHTGTEVFGATFAVAKFESHTIDWKVPVEVSIRDGIFTREWIEGAVLEVLPFVESLFGPFPFEQLGISVVRSETAYSSPTRIVVGVNRVDHSLLVHEIAHQWAGNAVGWEQEGSNWLFEGLANYAEALWAESLSDDIDLNVTTRELDDRVPPVTRTLDGVDTIDDLWDATTYDRGAPFYHALRLEIGDDAFFATVREFIQRNLHDTVLVEDLQAVAEEFSEQDLDEFFTAWVSDPEVPYLPVEAQS